MKLPTIYRFTIVSFLLLNALCSQSQNTYFNKLKKFDSPSFVDFADLNRDGVLDMIGVHGTVNQNVDIHLGNSDWTFTHFHTYTVSIPYAELVQILLADFNEDGIPDIVVGSEISQTVLMSTAPATYTVALNVELHNGGGGDLTLAAADFNGDTHQDLFFDNKVYINNGTGLLLPSGSVFLGINIEEAIVIDFNNDDHLDIVLTSPGFAILDFYAGKGDGTFSLSYTIRTELFWLLSFDFNHDGLMDIIGQNTNEELEIWYNSTSNPFERRSVVHLTIYDRLLGIFDVDHDGRDDVVTTDDRNLAHRTILDNGLLDEPVIFPVGGPTIRGILFKNVVGSEEPDIVVMSGFGVTKIFYHSPPPVIEASPLCLSEPVQFKSENLNYYDSLVWNFGDALSKSNISRVTSPEHQYTTEGTYNISLVTFVAGSVSESLTKTIFLKKTPTLELGSDISICQGSSSTLTVDKGYIYSWSTGETSDKIVVSESGLYKVQVTNGQCIKKDSIQVIVLDVPAINFPTSIESCEPFVVLDVGNSEFDIEWSTGELSQIIEVRQSGAYKVKVTNGICSTEGAIDVNLNGITNLQVSVEKDTVAYMERVTFSASANDVSEWQWDFGDGNFSSLQDPLHQFEFEGSYTVTLVATNLWGCQDSSILKLFASPYLFIPNVFTPNGDAVNDAFEIEYNGHDNGVLTIFSRWEKPIFQSKIGKPRWDGGNEASGTYYYYLSLGSKQYKGWITLVR